MHLYVALYKYQNNTITWQLYIMHQNTLIQYISWNNTVNCTTSYMQLVCYVVKWHRCDCVRIFVTYSTLCIFHYIYYLLICFVFHFIVIRYIYIHIWTINGYIVLKVFFLLCIVDNILYIDICYWKYNYTNKYKYNYGKLQE